MGFFLARHKHARAVSPRALVGRCFVGAVPWLSLFVPLFCLESEFPLKSAGEVHLHYWVEGSREDTDLQSFHVFHLESSSFCGLVAKIST